ncbi:IclR family transcriptional regulator [Rhodococcus globerulus]|uniref:IclR family transcriptional regulator n=1 Tax=Rhodococcus globerulus TaxID=33008 RepID=UPI003AFB1D98
MTTCNFDLESSPPAGEVEMPASMIERITQILDTFEGRMSLLTLNEVAAASRLPRSTVHRILYQLIQLNWVSHEESGYRLGRRALVLGNDANPLDQLRATTSPILHKLQLQTGMVVHLSVLDGSEIVYLDKIGGRLAAALSSRVGGRAPAYSTAGGKAMLAWHTPERVDSFYGNGLKRRTDRTISDLTTLHLELSRIRQRHGLAFEQGEAMSGIACLGAAIRIIDGPVAGISLAASVTEGNLERFAPRVMEAAREVSRALSPVTSFRPRRVAQTDDCSWSTQAFDDLLTG